MLFKVSVKQHGPERVENDIHFINEDGFSQFWWNILENTSASPPNLLYGRSDVCHTCCFSCASDRPGWWRYSRRFLLAIWQHLYWNAHNCWARVYTIPTSNTQTGAPAGPFLIKQSAVYVFTGRVWRTRQIQRMLKLSHEEEQQGRALWCKRRSRARAPGVRIQTDLRTSSKLQWWDFKQKTRIKRYSWVMKSFSFQWKL